MSAKSFVVGGKAATVALTGRESFSAAGCAHSRVFTVGAALKCVTPISRRSQSCGDSGGLRVRRRRPRGKSSQLRGKVGGLLGTLPATRP